MRGGGVVITTGISEPDEEKCAGGGAIGARGGATGPCDAVISEAVVGSECTTGAATCATGDNGGGALAVFAIGKGGGKLLGTRGGGKLPAESAVLLGAGGRARLGGSGGSRRVARTSASSGTAGAARWGGGGGMARRRTGGGGGPEAGSFNGASSSSAAAGGLESRFPVIACLA
jgi:hypothetical protein